MILPMRKTAVLLFLLVFITSYTRGGILQRGGRTKLICHRTANRDLPENTLESLGLAARMGCDIVEIDVRRTLDGKLVLNHDDMLERLTGGMGNVERTSWDELEMLETGTWMGERFPSLRIPRLEDALRVAREQGVGLYLDVKTKGIGLQLLAELRQEDMLQKVIFGGESEDVKTLDPSANGDASGSVGPKCTREQVDKLHRKGRFVIANFSETPYEMDLDAMRAAVAAGVDAINVDYPRIGAEAVGRPVETKLNALAKLASVGSTASRTDAIRELSRYYGFPTRSLFVQLLWDKDDQVSRAAAVALVRSMPRAQEAVFLSALSAPNGDARKNAAWALGNIHAPVAGVLAMKLQERDPEVLKEILLAISQCEGEVSADRLVPFLRNDSPTVRAAAALALVRHDPEVAAKEVPALLAREERHAAEDYAQYVRRGKPQLTQQEIDPIIEEYREQMKLVQAIEKLPPDTALRELTFQSFRPVEDYSHVIGLVAGYQLWDRIGTDPEPVIQQLGSSNPTIANRAEWILSKASPAALPVIRKAMERADPKIRAKLIRILAWQGDQDAIPLLQKARLDPGQNQAQIDWAIGKIKSLTLTH